MAFVSTSAPKKPSEGTGKTSESISSSRPEVVDTGYGTYYKGN